MLPGSLNRLNTGKQDISILLQVVDVAFGRSLTEEFDNRSLECVLLVACKEWLIKAMRTLE